MKKSVLFCLSLIVFYNTVFCQSVDLNYYLPDISYDDAVPTPEEFLGYQVGDWHVSHDQLTFYMRELAKKSDRVELVEYARSHENRPLIVLKISSTENLKNQSEIQRQHMQLCDSKKSSKVNIDKLPTIIYQGYSIHGNESSGANASMLVAYYLVAGQSAEVNEILDNTFILLDPCLNPDGLHRFSTWVNSNKGKNLVADPNSRELNEPWPRGRTNHYWFDLNRDWLLLTHPESQGRVKLFQEWRPNILTDHHEMGSNNTFFFMPGIPSRTNPSTPQKNQDLTGTIAEHHAEHLDKIGSLYYTKESFDDYYYGKGSTYPDANGSVGILFEQASSRGHSHDTDNGTLSFPFTIRNQVTTSLSTQQAGIEHRKELLDYKREFYQKGQNEAKNSSFSGYVFQSPGDQGKTNRFIDIMNMHQIDVYHFKNDQSLDGINFTKEDAFYIPFEQEQYHLVKTIFEKHTSFPDSLFYDVSTWNLPMAFDLQFAEASKSIKRGSIVNTSIPNKKSNKIVLSEYAYVMNWSDFYSSSALNKLLAQGIKCKVSTKPSVINSDDKKEEINKGSIIIPVSTQEISKEALRHILQDISDQYSIEIRSLSSGMQDSGVSIGSPSNKKINTQNIGLIVGSGTNSYEAGAAWYMLDFVHDVPVSLLDTRNFGSIDLSQYTTLIMADGSYNSINGSKDKINNWIKNGGNLIAMRRALNWLNNNKFIDVKTVKTTDKKQISDDLHYGEIAKIKGAQVTGGAILKAKMDLTHPLTFGYNDEDIHFFRRGNTNYELPSNPFSCPIKYDKKALVSGYMSKPNQEKINEKAAVFVKGLGRGQIICFVDNPNFRGYWWGGNKLFMNAIYFGDIIDRGAR